MNDEERWQQEMNVAATLVSWPEGVGKVYFIGASNRHVKIGFTTGSPLVRLGDLQVGNHESLVLLAVLPGTEQTEKSFHQLFYRHHVRGEWFRIEGAVKAFLLGIEHAPTALYVRIHAAKGQRLPWAWMGIDPENSE